MAVTCAGQRPAVLSGGSVLKRPRSVVCRFCGQRCAVQILWGFAALRDQGRQRLGSMEAEHRAAARLGIEAVRESRFHAGALIQKWQGSDMSG